MTCQFVAALIHGQEVCPTLGNYNSLDRLRSAALIGLVVAALGVPMAGAQDFTYHDDFNDGDVSGSTAGGLWILNNNSQPGTTMDASSGDLVINADGEFSGAFLRAVDGVTTPSGSEWSFRAHMTVHSGDFAAVGTQVFNHAGLLPDGAGGGVLRVGTGSDNSSVPLNYPYYDDEVIIQMDAFDGTITGNVWKAGQYATTRVQHSWPYTPTSTRPGFGVGLTPNGGHVTFHEVWITNVAPFKNHEADFDGDGDVDGTDFLLWQRGESPAPLSASDLADWQAIFGTDVVPSTFALSRIPEPASIVLAGLCLAIIGGCRRW